MGRPAKPLTNKSGVYLLKVGEAHYVGSSKYLAQRIYEHERLLKQGEHHNKDLQEAYDKYQSVLHEVLEFVPPEQPELLKAEQKYYDVMRQKVYLVNAGELAHCWNKGKPVSEEMKQRISSTLKESGVCKGENNPFFGKKHSKESVERMVEVHRKYVVRDETKVLMREIHKGRKMDDESIHKRQLSRTEGGKPYTTRADFIALDGHGVEKLRFKTIKDFVSEGFCKCSVYKSIRTSVPYRDLYWKKEI